MVVRPQGVRDRLGTVAGSYAGVVRSPSYFPLWRAQLLSAFGDTLHYVALVVLIYRLTGQGAAVAALVVAEVIPVLLLGPVAGVVIDRFSRRGVLIGADMVRAALAFSLVWPQGAGHVYLVAAGLAASAAFFNPTVQAVIPALTTEEQRLAANSVAWSTGRLVQIVGAAVAGGLVGLVGTGPAFFLNAATFVASAALIATLSIPVHGGQLDARSRRGLNGYLWDVRRGLAYARHDRFVSRLLPVQALASFATGGDWSAAGGPGGAAPALAAGRVRLADRGYRHRRPPGPLIPNGIGADPRDARWLFVPYIVRGVGDVLIALFVPLPVALLLLFVYGLGTSTGMVVFGTALQTRVADTVRGRVFTLLDATWSAGRLLSLAMGGLAVDAIGVRPIFWAGGSLLALAGGLGLIFLREDDRGGAVASA